MIDLLKGPTFSNVTAASGKNARISDALTS